MLRKVGASAPKTMGASVRNFRWVQDKEYRAKGLTKMQGLEANMPQERPRVNVDIFNETVYNPQSTNVDHWGEKELFEKFFILIKIRIILSENLPKPKKG